MPEGKRLPGRIELGDRVILRWILEKWVGMVWTGFIWLRIGTIECLL
jgi:hypothetical protein